MLLSSKIVGNPYLGITSCLVSFACMVSDPVYNTRIPGSTEVIVLMMLRGIAFKSFSGILAVALCGLTWVCRVRVVFPATSTEGGVSGHEAVRDALRLAGRLLRVAQAPSAWASCG